MTPATPGAPIDARRQVVGGTVLVRAAQRARAAAGIAVAFLPFIAFGLLNGRLGTALALAVGSAIAAVLAVRTVWSGAHWKVLEVGTVVLFSGLTLYAFVDRRPVPVTTARLVLDAGLAAIMWLSIGLRRPFTLQYARERVPETVWKSAGFVRKNFRISETWGVVAVCSVLSDAMFADPAIPRAVASAVQIVALLGGAWWTKKIVKQSNAPAT